MAWENFELRRLVQIVPNPAYRYGFKRGLIAVRQFYPTMQFIVYRPKPQVSIKERDFFSWADVSIDIPMLGLKRISSAPVIGKLLGASRIEDHQKQVVAPAGEAFIGCGDCKGNLWLNLIDAKRGSQSGSICAKCGNRMRIKRVFHAAGRA